MKNRLNEPQMSNRLTTFWNTIWNRLIPYRWEETLSGQQYIACLMCYQESALDKMGFELVPLSIEHTEPKYGFLRHTPIGHPLRKPFFFKIEGDDEWRVIL